MNRKGQLSHLMLQTIPRIIFLIIVLFSVIFLVRQFVIDNLDVRYAEAEIFSSRIVYSPNGILYYDDELKTTTPGVIDVDKFKDSNLDKLMDYNDTSFIAGKLQLFDLNNKEIGSAYYNKKTYDRWITIANLKITGKGGVTRITKSTYVNFVQNKTAKPGVLKFDILLPGN